MVNPVEVLRRLVRNVDAIARGVPAIGLQLQEMTDLQRTQAARHEKMFQELTDLQRAQAAMLSSQLQGIADVLRPHAPDSAAPAPAAPGAREQAAVEIGPVADIPYPAMDLSLVENPTRRILESPEYVAADRFFHASPAVARSLVSSRSQAVLYGLIRNLRPEHVFEIGTYRLGTSEAICRALHANGRGLLHTTDPFAPEVIQGILDQWPEELRAHIRLYPLESMAFYGRMARSPELRPQLIFVDGNHDYEYAAFDIESAARLLVPGGFIVIDNIAQAGPYLAATDFLKMNPGWTECAAAEYSYDPAKAFDRGRKGIPGTEFMILRAPRGPVIGERPIAFPEIVLVNRAMTGIEIVPGRADHDGVLHAQCIARGFASGQKPIERAGAVSTPIGGDQGGQRLRFPIPIEIDPESFEHIRVEIWLSWAGKTPLQLLEAPGAY